MDKNYFEARINTDSVMRLIPENAKCILDFGCGNGYMTHKLSQNYDAMGYDISQKMRDIARAKYRVEIIDSPGGTYDCVLLKLVLHFIDNLEAFLPKIARLVAPNGTVVISVPHPVRTATQYKKMYSKSFVYTNELAQTGLKSQMVHRPIWDICEKFANIGFVLADIDEVIDADRGDILPKRLNMRFESIK